MAITITTDSLNIRENAMIVDVHSHVWEYPDHFSSDFRDQAKRARADVEMDLTVRYEDYAASASEPNWPMKKIEPIKNPASKKLVPAIGNPIRKMARNWVQSGRQNRPRTA